MGTRYGHGRNRTFEKPYVPGKLWHPASELKEELTGRVVLVMGQAYSLNYVDLDKLKGFPTFGCNRCLRPDCHVQWDYDYYVCVDRDPYAQEVERVRRFKGKPILSEMLFDHNNMHKKKALRTHWAPLQPEPDFDWWGFKPVSSSRPRYNGRHCYTGWPEMDRTLRNGIIPTFGMDLDLLLTGAANVAYSMFQIAAAMGASVIGIVGVDLAWESKKKSHSYGTGNGKAAGAFELNPRHTLPFFRSGLKTCQEAGIEVYNLSPRGVLSPTIPRISAAEFNKRFGGYADGSVLRPRQQCEPDPNRPSGIDPVKRRHNRYKPRPPRDAGGLPPARRSHSAGGGKDQVEARKERAARIKRARLRGSKDAAGN